MSENGSATTHGTHEGVLFDDEQRDAIEHFEGPLLVASGPGSGKTRILVYRIIRLFGRDVRPDQILAATFTREAAREMNERLVRLGAPPNLRVGTLHSVAYEILRQDGQAWGGGFLVDDRGSLLFLLKELISRHFKQMDYDQAVKLIANLKANCLPGHPSIIEEYEEDIYRAASRLFQWPGAERDAFDLYRRYEQARMERRLLDFDDMMLGGWLTLTRDEAVRTAWQRRFRFVLIDEAQDSSHVQHEFAGILAGGTGNLMLISDPSQSMYGWRSAKTQLVLDFGQRAGVRTIKLPRNYRSDPRICAAASQLVRGEKWHLAGDIVPERAPNPYEPIEVRAFPNAQDEGEWVADQIQQLQQDGVPLGGMAVLYRITALLGAVESALVRRQIPYRVLSGMTFYDRREVKDLLAYLRVVTLADPDGSAAERCVNTPFRYLGKVFVQKCRTYALEHQVSFVDALKAVQDVKPAQRRAAVDLYETLAAANQLVGRGRGPADVLRFLLDRTHYIAWLKRDGTGGADPEAAGREVAVYELLRTAEAFPSVAALLNYIDHVNRALKAARTRKDRPDVVQLLTIHRCVHPSTIVETNKGLNAIFSIPNEGLIGTTKRATRYINKIVYRDCPLLKITTRCGYELITTEEHGLQAWTGQQYERVEAYDLHVGQFLRLRLGAAIDPATVVPLPPTRRSGFDTRARIFHTPLYLTENVAEFLGLCVADGTVFHAGFRLGKRHHDVARRFGELAHKLFGTPVSYRRSGRMLIAEVSSVQLASWLLGIDGLAPNRKAIPTAILQSPLREQGRFLRGLFEDGTVNVKTCRGRRILDHIGFTSKYAPIARLVQTMLLRFGIISSRLRVSHPGGHTCWRITISGRNAKRFGRAIGFVSHYKQMALRHPTGREWFVLPVAKERLSCSTWTGQNGRYRGRLSRHAAEQLGGFEEDLQFHHDPIRSIKRTRGPAVCVEVPRGSRFLQNGFDGWNSKGREWNAVFVIGCNEGILPHHKNLDRGEEKRVMYVAMTRAKDRLYLSYLDRAATSDGITKGAASRFIRIAGLKLPDDPATPSPTLQLDDQPVP